MGVKYGEQEHKGNRSREKLWPNLKGCNIKEENGEEGHKMAYFDRLFTYQLSVQ